MNPNTMTRILGIDPGSRITGYGIIEVHGGRHVHVADGCLRVGEGELPQRLGAIFAGIEAVLEEYAPMQAAVVRVFVQRNVDSALKLGQARGAAICAVVQRGLPVAEYTPAEIKKALVGRGAAAKEQVQHMVKALLALEETPAADAADALACALCHGHTRQTLLHVPAGGKLRSGRTKRGGWR